MTARQQQIRVARLTRDRAPIESLMAPTVGELLQAAREKKGVDLYRAERDTKIRARHLAALESGEYSEMAGAVYTKGFLRNYALYLGLDPEELLERWRVEQDFGRRGEPLSVTPPPQPLSEPHRGLTFSPALLIAAAISIVVLLFVGYIGLQLVRFSQVPAITLDGDRNMTLASDAGFVELKGTAGAGFAINVADASGSILVTVPADDAGAWSTELAVTKGRNDFTLVARDPATGRESDPLQIIVTVPINGGNGNGDGNGGKSSGDSSKGPSVAASGSGQRATPVAMQGQPVAQLELRAPKGGADVANAPVEVDGTSDAPSVTVSAEWQGDGRGPGAPDPVSVKTGKQGRFSASLTLPSGRWAIVVTTDPQERIDGASDRRTVNVKHQGLWVVIQQRGGSAWVRVWTDGDPVERGHRYNRGDTVSYTAKKSAVVSSGNAGSTYVTVNGVPYGSLGANGKIQAVQFEKGKDPRPVN